MKKCKYCDYTTEDGRKLGGHLSTCKYNPNLENRIKKIVIKNKMRKVTDETKKKISDSRKKYLSENPDKVPYMLNHSRKDSYPEIYFYEILSSYNLNFEKKYRIWVYELDFCILDKKIDIEIDGDQHYLDKKIVESDKKRNEYLEKNGWDIIRIKWSDYQKLDYASKQKYIEDLVMYIKNLIDFKPTFDIERKENKCECGKKIWRRSKKCNDCSRLSSRKTIRPPYEVLLEEVNNNGYSSTGRKYGVTGSSIKKWLKNKEL